MDVDKSCYKIKVEFYMNSIRIIFKNYYANNYVIKQNLNFI